MKQRKLWVVATAIGAALVLAALIAATAGAGTGGRLIFFNDSLRAIPDAPDGGGVLSKVRVRGGGRIRDINVAIRINHTADGDLNIYLVSPTGKFVELSTDNGGSGNDYGTGTNSCRGRGTLTTFTDEAGRSIRNGAPPFSGSFRPQTPLSALNGDSISGTWRLMVFDDDARDTGTIGCFAIGVILR